MSGHAMRRRLEAKRFAVRKEGRVDLKRQSLCRCVLLFTERAAQVRGKGSLRIVVDQKDFHACGIEGGTEVQ